MTPRGPKENIEWVLRYGFFDANMGQKCKNERPPSSLLRPPPPSSHLKLLLVQLKGCPHLHALSDHSLQTQFSTRQQVPA